MSEDAALYSRVYVEITNVCNMNCSFCHGHKRAPRFMTGEEFDIILNKLSLHTKYVYYHLMGEPLLHPELPQFLKMAKEKGFKSVITTNGTLLAERGEELIRCGVHKVSISLHSFEENSKSEHVKYLTGTADFAQKATRAGTIVVFRLWNKGFDDGKNDVAIDNLKRLIPGEWAENPRGIRIKENMYLEWGERFAWPDSDAPMQGNDVFCYGMRDHFGILCDGSIVPCCLDSEGAVTLGNVYTDNLTRVLASHRAQAIAKGFERREASEELCRRCSYAQRFSKK